MKAYSLNELRKTLLEMEPVELSNLCLRLARYKKESKELLSYLLYESANEQEYVEGILAETDSLFESLEFNTTYKFTKQVRKILRYINKHIKYSGLPSTQVELLIHFCRKLQPELKRKKNLTALSNVYLLQIKKIHIALGKLHEDLQYDFLKSLKELEGNA